MVSHKEHNARAHIPPLYVYVQLARNPAMLVYNSLIHLFVSHLGILMIGR